MKTKLCCISLFFLSKDLTFGPFLLAWHVLSLQVFWLTPLLVNGTAYLPTSYLFLTFAAQRQYSYKTSAHLNTYGFNDLNLVKKAIGLWSVYTTKSQPNLPNLTSK